MKHILSNIKTIIAKPQYLKSIAIFIVSILLITVKINAQIIDPGDDPDVPIDGGLSLLVAAGVGYGAKQLKKRKKENLK